VLTPALMVMLPKSTFLELQLQYRLNGHLYLIGSYGYGWHQFENNYLISTGTSARWELLKGTATPDYSGAFRIYPFSENRNEFLNYIFFDLGYRWKQRTESTEIKQYTTSIDLPEVHYINNINFSSDIIFLNIGLSQLYSKGLKRSSNNTPVFSPEISVGLNYTFYTINSQTTINYLGNSGSNGSLKNEFGFYLRGKIGFGFGK
jgi:hypothetical protein